MHDFTDWSLGEHGDSFEKYWHEIVLSEFPSYEGFWKNHVVPLSFRIYDQNNYFIRPDLPAHLETLADGSYATFYHIAYAHFYGGDLVLNQRENFAATENLYCFFTHAHSAREALLLFCSAVNDVLKTYGRPGVFQLAAGDHGPRELHGSRQHDTEDHTINIKAYEILRSYLHSYRNTLIHKKPIFIQNDLIPKRSKAEEYSGLAAISRLALDKKRLRRDFEPTKAVTATVIDSLKRLADSVFLVAWRELDCLLETDYANDRKSTKRGHHLDLAKIQRLRKRS